MNKITVIAPAKINLCLDITGTDDRGYHLLDMVMQSVSVYEKVTLEKQDSGISLSSNARYIPTDEKNVAVKAAMKFFRYSKIDGGVHIFIKKTVPIKAGMAGGSADAAGVIVGLDRLYHTGYSLRQLCEIGAAAGSDVPFMIAGGTRRVQGVGDVILPCRPMPACHIVIGMPSRGVSTPAAFARYDELGSSRPANTGALVQALENKDLTAACRLMSNSLEEAAAGEQTQTLKALMMKYGALGSLMTGSGAAVFGVFDDRRKARAAYNRVREKCRSAFLARPVTHGAKVVKKNERRGKNGSYRQVGTSRNPGGRQRQI